MLAVGLTLVPWGEEVISCTPKGVMVYHSSVHECHIGDTYTAKVPRRKPHCRRVKMPTFTGPERKNMVKKKHADEASQTLVYIICYQKAVGLTGYVPNILHLDTP